MDHTNCLQVAIKTIQFSVGVMKDYKLKQRNLRASHTLGENDLKGEGKKRRKTK
jgi:hypothetical protein